MLNSEINISKNHINAIDASIGLNQYLITLPKKIILTYITDTVGVHRILLHILFQFIRPMF